MVYYTTLRHPQDMPLWSKDYFKRIILRNCRHRRSCESRVDVILLSGKFTLKRGAVPGRELLPETAFSLRSLTCLGRQTWLSIHFLFSPSCELPSPHLKPQSPVGFLSSSGIFKSQSPGCLWSLISLWVSGQEVGD